jgi:FAD dependent oxidoreductase
VESALLGRVTLTGAYFIDATELGDLLPLAKVEHVVGSESRKETGEPSAPEEADPMDQQAVTWCFAMDHLEGEDHVIPKPARWDFWSQYVPDLKPAWSGPLFSWDYSDPVSLKSRRLPFDPMLRVTGLNLWTYRRIVDQAQFVPGTYRGGTTLVNWPQNDYWLAPLIGPGVTPQQKEERLLDARQVSLCLLYWMQTQAPRPDGGTGWKGLRLRPDVTDGPAGLAKSVYIRESRRILAEFTVTENHVGTDARMKQTGKAKEEVTAEVFPDSVGVGAYRIDLHPSTSGRNYVDISSVPFQIPLGALIPRRVENLLAGCKNLGVTHLTNGCYRLHPVEWNIGEAAGAVASFCLDRKESPRAVRATPKLLADFQQRLRNQGFELEWPRTRPL